MISLSALTFMRLLLLYSDTQIRLTGHSATFAGRVEVFAHGVWGRVLHSWSPKWGQNEAAVVCRQLGFPGVITALRYSSFGEGSGPVLMTNVQCTGNEKTLQQCQYVDWVGSDVEDGENGLEVGVICKTHEFDPFVSDISVRLQGSSIPNAGRVEVLYAGIWGAISRTFSARWDINAATVVCRQLGFQGGAEVALTNDVYGPGSGPVWLTNLQCSGSEANVMSCSHDVIGTKSELHLRSYVASVICKNGSSPNGMSVRLRGSLSPNMGRVEVYYAGKWGSIYYNNWDINEARVVCRQLGYSTALMSGYGLFCSAAVPQWFRNFKCYGNESSLDQCTWDFLVTSSYTSCANVMCKEKIPAGFEMRLSGSPVPHAGRVELRFNGVWGTISSPLEHSRIYPEITRVICRQLNFTDGILATAWLVFGPGTGPQWFESRDLHCLGNEANLLNCNYTEPHLTRNKKYSDVSVVCKPDFLQTSEFPLRLNGSSLPYVGLIEVMYHGIWGGVISHYIDINVGHVVCRQLGYSGAEKIFERAAFGRVKGPMWIWKIQCSGSEPKISDCVVTTWENATNPHPSFQNPNFAAGVLCNEANSSASKDLNVRLAGAPISNAGRVEVFYLGVWGTLFYRELAINFAHVICRQLGYPGALSTGISDRFGVGAGPVWFENVRCLGNESNLGECSKGVLGYPNGEIADVATALCKLPYKTDNSLNCSQINCANNGTCIKTAVGAVCNCSDGYTGLHCEIPTFNPCHGSLCDNDGKCFSSGSSYICACPEGLTGKRCEKLIVTAINPCQSRPCLNNTSCHHNETHYSCVPNNKETTTIDENGTRLKNSGKSSTTAAAEQNIFNNTPFIVLLSVSLVVIALLIAAVVYLVLQNRSLTKHAPSNQGAVFSNIAYKGDLENRQNLSEAEANHSDNIDIGTGTTQNQEREDPEAIYEEASRPLPPIPAPTSVPKNTTRKEEADTRVVVNRTNVTPASVPRASGEHYMGLSLENENNATPNVPPHTGAGTYSNNYMPLLPAGRPGDTSYLSLNSSGLQNPGPKQHGNSVKRSKESLKTYENTGK